MSTSLSSDLEPSTNGCRKYTFELEIASDPAEAQRVHELIERELRSHQFGDRDIFGIRLALEEAIGNAIKHGNQLDRSKKVRIAYHVDHVRFDVHIADEGRGFDPEDVPDPTSPENLERPCGRGLMLMRHYMSEVHYSSHGNSVSMTKFAKQ